MGFYNTSQKIEFLEAAYRMQSWFLADYLLGP